MALEDASSTSSTGFVRSVERIEEDGHCANREGEDDDDWESPNAIILNYGDKVLWQFLKEKVVIGVWNKLEGL